MKDALLGEIKEDLLWDPVLVEDITEEEGTFKKELQVQILKTIDLFFLLIYFKNFNCMFPKKVG